MKSDFSPDFDEPDDSKKASIPTDMVIIRPRHKRDPPRRLSSCVTLETCRIVPLLIATRLFEVGADRPADFYEHVIPAPADVMKTVARPRPTLHHDRHKTDKHVRTGVE